jgi:opacity protein-like surface antigen
MIRDAVRPLVLVAAPLACLLAAPIDARADEKEWILAIEPAAALIHVGDASGWGGGGALDLSYGVTDAIAVRLTGATTGHVLSATKDDPGGPLVAYHVGAGLTYTIDIFRVVPYVDFDIGLLGTARSVGGKWQTSNNFGMQIGLGADYLVNRRVAIGLVVRYNAFLTDLSNIPVYLYFGPRVAIHFGG